MNSTFASLTALPPDPVLNLAVAYDNCQAEDKVNLGIGAYRTEEGKPHVFEVVREADIELANDLTVFKEYLREDGLDSLKPLTQKLVFGSPSDCISSIQSLGGTGALCIAANLLKTQLAPNAKVYVSEPTWPNHQAVFKLAGYSKISSYPYWDPVTKSLDIEGMLKTLEEAPDGSIIILHACAHNPTGVDPTNLQWAQIVNACKERNHIPLLDFAYQGFATGCIVRDRYAIELFHKSEMEFFVAQSLSKNLGMYGERLGMLHVATASAEIASTLSSHLRVLARRLWSNPPIHPAFIAEQVLSNPDRYQRWLSELSEVSGRLQSIRQKLGDGLIKKCTSSNWEHITKQIGMFSFTGLNAAASERMTDVHHVFMMKNGRISLAGLNNSNLNKVISAIDECVLHQTVEPKLQSGQANVQKTASKMVGV